MEELHRKVPCRKQQVSMLASLFGEPTHWGFPSIFIYGHTATGKSLVTSELLNAYQLPHVVVNCVETYTSRLVYEHILNGAANTCPCVENDFSPYAGCDNMNDFVRLMKKALAEQEVKETFYVILDKAERLCDMSANLLPGLLRLQELTRLNITVILLSEIVWEKFHSGTGFLEPCVIHFPDYSKDELIEIMASDCPSDYPEEFYTNYCNLILSVFHYVCKNLNELRHLALLNFPKYVEPIKNEEATLENVSKLWRNIEPHLKKALQTVYLREVSSAQWEKMQEIAAENQPSQMQGLTSRVHVELPFYSKYLLIAAYIASYNPVKTDKRFFLKAKAKVTKRALLATMKRNDRTSNQMLGPKQFPMDRLLAIFYAIVDGNVAPSANIFSQISSLVTLGILAQIASADQLDAPKYKCLVSLEFVKSVARTVKFEVVQYLYDFV